MDLLKPSGFSADGRIEGRAAAVGSLASLFPVLMLRGQSYG